MVERVRLDSALVRQGLARSRRHASELLTAGRVSVDGARTVKSSTPVGPGQVLTVAERPDAGPDYASRAGHKLAGALDVLGVDGPRVHGRICLDAGASTGGFTDVLLRRGATHVLAVDVGHDQLVPWLRADPRVTVREGVNVRNLHAGAFDPAPELVVGDLSFISLTLVLPALVAAAAPGADLLLLVKPQFEVGRERLGTGGVVRSPQLRAESVLAVARSAGPLGLRTQAVVASALPGPSGNVEYFVWLVAAAGTTVPAAAAATPDADLIALVDRAVAAGPTGEGTSWTSGGDQ
ncbi:TlyA family RNA methyltransferase [Pengzhenrongella frigida]|uniref:TlyA family RNA methyltransferase n=1 Tax=Pengzhenrongella frigida TaxID=1259133 RepID=A0A4Q5MY09_9MICO|nr:TlyA family RNA methyltransferase [Cellulomonas sp. HLT2-17]RYV50568.1 TlyA family RNA methyltransferase [Cellulomonas sp. HLT2-17]